jgi:diguanylate cyclase (GGDEF)-like protein
MLVLSIAATGGLVASIGGYLAKTVLEYPIERSIAELPNNLAPAFATFDTLIEQEERAIRAKLTADLPRMHKDLTASGIAVADIALDDLAAAVKRYGFSEGYVVNRDGVIVTTTFRPDLNFDLKTISPQFAAWLDGMYNSGTVVSDRLVLATRTGTLNVYGYYSPPGSDAILEASINVRDYVGNHHAADYVDFLFHSLFEDAMQANGRVREADLFMYNDLAAWSVLNEGVALDADVRRRLRDDSAVRIYDGDTLTAYTRFTPARKKLPINQSFCTKIVYDLSELNLILWKMALFTLLAIAAILPLVYFLASFILGRRVIGPTNAIMAALDAIGRGRYTGDLDVQGVPEVRTIAAAVNGMHREIRQRETALADARDILEQRVEERTRALDVARRKAESLARTDPLTALPNRRCFRETGEAAVALARRFGHVLGVIVMDLDHFKRVNDSHGHAAGDAVLVAVAEALRHVSREVDGTGRLGGEEFALVLPETTLDQAVAVAERLRRHLAGLEIPFGGAVLTITASFGVSAFRPTHASLDAILAEADTALYAAKRRGRDAVEIFRPKAAVP